MEEREGLGVITMLGEEGGARSDNYASNKLSTKYQTLYVSQSCCHEPLFMQSEIKVHAGTCEQLTDV